MIMILILKGLFVPSLEFSKITFQHNDYALYFRIIGEQLQRHVKTQPTTTAKQYEQPNLT
jgi:hypothetical protein